MQGLLDAHRPGLGPGTLPKRPGSREEAVQGRRPSVLHTALLRASLDNLCLQVLLPPHCCPPSQASSLPPTPPLLLAPASAFSRPEPSLSLQCSCSPCEEASCLGQAPACPRCAQSQCRSGGRERSSPELSQTLLLGHVLLGLTPDPASAVGLRASVLPAAAESSSAAAWLALPRRLRVRAVEVSPAAGIGCP